MRYFIDVMINNAINFIFVQINFINYMILFFHYDIGFGMASKDSKLRKGLRDKNLTKLAAMNRKLESSTPTVSGILQIIK